MMNNFSIRNLFPIVAYSLLSLSIAACSGENQSSPTTNKITFGDSTNIVTKKTSILNALENGKPIGMITVTCHGSDEPAGIYTAVMGGKESAPTLHESSIVYQEDGTVQALDITTGYPPYTAFHDLLQEPGTMIGSSIPKTGLSIEMFCSDEAGMPRREDMTYRLGQLIKQYRNGKTYE